MKNKFITKKPRRKKKILFLLCMFILGVYASYKNFERSRLRITDKALVDLVINNSFKETNNILEKLIDETLKVSNPIKLLNKDYNKYLNNTLKEEHREVLKENTNPKIYIYNTHQTEEYASSTYAEFSINPTVVMNNYILEDIFNKNGYKTLVEERKIKEVLNENKWSYSNSYKASRIFLEDAIIKYPSLEYFIDVHRDSLKKDKTSVTINNKAYAKVLFIVGLENKNYQKNLALTEKINKKITDLYPGLSKGIYKKSGPGVNGVYNQDFSGNTILVEMGGYENNTTEVLNTSIAFAHCFLEAINEENS